MIKYLFQNFSSNGIEDGSNEQSGGNGISFGREEEEE